MKNAPRKNTRRDGFSLHTPIGYSYASVRFNAGEPPLRRKATLN